MSENIKETFEEQMPASLFEVSLYLNTNMDEVAMKKAVIQAANRNVVLCDHSKFEAVAFMSICDFGSVDLLITDNGVAPEVVQMLQAKKAVIQLV